MSIDDSSMTTDAETTIHIDNSIKYETDKQDFWLFELISPYLIQKLGKTKLLLAGIVSVVLGFISIVGQSYTTSYPYLSWFGVLFLFYWNNLHCCCKISFSHSMQKM